MRKHLSTIVLLFILLIGLSLLLYPTVSDYWNSFHQTRAIATYAENVAALDNASYDAIWDAARQYNRNLCSRSNSFLLSQEQKAEYESLLDISGQGVMGYIEIPEIDVSLPIYHGTEDPVLQVAIGHLEWSSLPVGGESTHCVLSGHRGLPSAKLFTDLDKLREGDTFLLRDQYPPAAGSRTPHRQYRGSQNRAGHRRRRPVRAHVGGARRGDPHAADSVDPSAAAQAQKEIGGFFMRKHVISGLLALLFLLALPLSAAAHAVPDESRNGHCSITVSMTYKGKAVRGGTLALYKVGDVAEDDGNYSFVPVEEIQADIPEFGDIESPDLAGRLAELEGKLTPVTSDPVTVDKDGNATFSDLTFGLYLVVQKTAASGYGKTAPFLVSVPYLYADEYQYDVTSQPKTDLEREVKPTAPPSSGGGKKLPQTGQLWWPVPVLACAGLGCIAVGLFRRREARDEG